MALQQFQRALAVFRAAFALDQHVGERWQRSPGPGAQRTLEQVACTHRIILADRDGKMGPRGRAVVGFQEPDSAGTLLGIRQLDQHSAEVDRILGRIGVLGRFRDRLLHPVGGRVDITLDDAALLEIDRIAQDRVWMTQFGRLAQGFAGLPGLDDL